MSQQFDAIYENGILRPLVPLALPEQTRVTITVDSKLLSEPESLTKQKAALKKLWEEIDRLPRVENYDGWSVRQHDDLLYGGDQ